MAEELFYISCGISERNPKNVLEWNGMARAAGLLPIERNLRVLGSLPKGGSSLHIAFLRFVPAK